MRQQTLVTLAILMHHCSPIKGWDVPENRNFDPEQDDLEVLNCSLPPRQDARNYPKPEDKTCAQKSIPLESLAPEELHALAEAYAPVLFFHPLDETSLQSADAIFDNPSNGKIYKQPKENEDEPTLIDNELNLETLLLISQPDVDDGEDYYFEHIDKDDLKAGAGYDYKDNVGFSKASIYYNVLETGSGTWVFNYYFYYPGQQGQTIGFGLGLNQHTVVDFQPYGGHDGDWEAMSVLACQSLTPVRPAAILYQQHGFSQITDCNNGECIFWKQTNHPVGFVALSTHAIYPVVSRNHVYLALTFNLPFLLPGFVFLTDQTVYRDEDTGAYRMFFPNATNIVHHKDPEEIIPGVTPVSDYWQGYGGRWGSSWAGSAIPDPVEPTRCLNMAQNQWQECPNIPLLDAILDIVASSFTKAIGCLLPNVGAFLRQANAPYGPPRKDFFSEWEPPKSANLWSTTFSFTSEESLCRSLGNPITIENEDTYIEGTAAITFRLAMTATTFVSNVVGVLLGALFRS